MKLEDLDKLDKMGSTCHAGVWSLIEECPILAVASIGIRETSIYAVKGRRGEYTSIWAFAGPCLWVNNRPCFAIKHATSPKSFNPVIVRSGTGVVTLVFKMKGHFGARIGSLLILDDWILEDFVFLLIINRYPRPIVIDLHDKRTKEVSFLTPTDTIQEQSWKGSTWNGLIIAIEYSIGIEEGNRKGKALWKLRDCIWNNESLTINLKVPFIAISYRGQSIPNCRMGVQYTNQRVRLRIITQNNLNIIQRTIRWIFDSNEAKSSSIVDDEVTLTEIGGGKL